MTARSMTCCSSRTLPGHAKLTSARSASGVERHDGLAVLRGVLAQEILGHQRNVGRPLAERGHGQHERVDAEVQVLAQPPFLERADRR